MKRFCRTCDELIEDENLTFVCRTNQYETFIDKAGLAHTLISEKRTLERLRKQAKPKPAEIFLPPAPPVMPERSSRLPIVLKYIAPKPKVEQQIPSAKEPEPLTVEKIVAAVLKTKAVEEPPPMPAEPQAEVMDNNLPELPTPEHVFGIITEWNQDFADGVVMVVPPYDKSIALCGAEIAVNPHDLVTEGWLEKDKLIAFIPGKPDFKKSRLRARRICIYETPPGQEERDV